MNSKEYNCYPVFETNQILTSTQLNKLRNKGEYETNKTRYEYVGVGIKCDFYFIKKGNEITIEHGDGLSSSGYRIFLEKKTAFNSYIDFKEHKGPKYDLFYDTIDKKKQLKNIKQLIPSVEKNEKARTLDKLTDLDQRVVVAFYDLTDKQHQTCTGNDCDNKGIKREESIIFLLIKKSDLSKFSLEKALMLKNKINNLRIKRLHSTNGFNLNKVDSEKKLDEEFLKAIDKYNLEVGKEIRNAYEVYDKILGLEISVDKQLVKLLSKEFDTIKPLQYRYDFLNDILLALYEFSEYAYELLCNYRVEFDDFPRHLMLGEISPSASTNILEYRNYFVKAPVFSKQDKKFLTARMLYEKIINMIINFAVPSDKDPNIKIKVTPGKYFPEPFSNFTIPYQYKPTKEILNFWNPVFTIQERLTENLSYFFNGDTGNTKLPAHISDPLSYNINDYPYYRIEGHVEKNVKLAEQTIMKLKHNYNLDFRLITLRVNPHDSKNIHEIKKLFLEKCGIEELQGLYSEMRIEFVCKLKEFVYAFQGGIVSRFVDKIQDYGFIIKKEILENELLKSGKELVEAIKIDFSDKFLNKVLEGVPEDFSSLEIQKTLKSLNGFNELLMKVKLAFKLIEKIIPQILSGRTYYKIPVIKGEVDKCIEIVDKVLYCCFTNRAFFLHRIFLWRMNYFLNHDLSIFKNYVNKYTGIDHLAGVLRGGTFILVYNEKGIVIADFALNSSCCDTCFFPPFKVEHIPVATPIYVEIPQQKCGSEIIGEINVLQHDVNPEILKEFTWKLTKSESDGGAKIEFNPEKKVVLYKGGKEILFDRFDYTLTSKKYGYEGSASIYVFVKRAVHGILDAVDDVSATVKTKPIMIDVLQNDLYYKSTAVELISQETNLPAEKIVTKLGAEVYVKKEKAKQFISYNPGNEGFDKIKYRLTDACALNKSDAFVNVIVYCCDKECVDIAQMNKENVLRVLNEMELEKDVTLKLFKDDPNSLSDKLKTAFGEAMIAKVKGMPVIIYIPTKDFFGKDRFGYVVKGKNYYRYCHLNVIVIGEYEKPVVECTLPKIEHTVVTKNEFEIDLNKEAPQAELKSLGAIDANIIEAKIKDAKTISVTPKTGLIEAKEYEFNYSAFDTNAKKECTAGILLTVDPALYEKCELPNLTIKIPIDKEFITVNFTTIEKTKDITKTNILPDAGNQIGVAPKGGEEFDIYFHKTFETLTVTYTGTRGKQTDCAGTITIIREFPTETTITGIVTEDGYPVYNAKVVIKETGTSSTTKDDGKYILLVPSGGDTIQAIIKGELRAEEPIGSRIKIDFHLTKTTTTETKIDFNKIHTITSSENYLSIAGVDNKIYENSNAAIEFNSAVSATFSDNLGVVKTGKYNAEILEMFKYTFDPVINEINKINKEIKASGENAELKKRKSVNMELLKYGLNTLIGTVAENDRDLSKTSNVYMYFNEEFKAAFNKFEAVDKSELSGMMSSWAINNSGRKNFSSLLSGYKG